MVIVNNSAVTLYHTLDAVVRGMFTTPADVAFTNTNTISCVLQLHHSDVWWWILVVKQCMATQLYPKMPRHFIKLLCYYIWTLYYIRTGSYMDFLDSNLQ